LGDVVMFVLIFNWKMNFNNNCINL